MPTSVFQGQKYGPGQGGKVGGQCQGQTRERNSRTVLGSDWGREQPDSAWARLGREAAGQCLGQTGEGSSWTVPGPDCTQQMQGNNPQKTAEKTAKKTGFGHEKLPRKLLKKIGFKHRKRPRKLQKNC